MSSPVGPEIFRPFSTFFPAKTFFCSINSLLWPYFILITYICLYFPPTKPGEVKYYTSKRNHIWKELHSWKETPWNSMSVSLDDAHRFHMHGSGILDSFESTRNWACLSSAECRRLLIYLFTAYGPSRCPEMFLEFWSTSLQCKGFWCQIFKSS